MPTLPYSSTDLQEVNTRNDHARRIVAGFASALPALADIWRDIDHRARRYGRALGGHHPAFRRTARHAAGPRQPARRDARRARRARGWRARPAVLPPRRARHARDALCGLAEATVTIYRRMRRQARQARRSGLQPMVVINSGDPLPELAAVIIARWAFRHRSAFAPFWVAPAAFIAAGAAHGHHARWWIPVTAVTAVTTIVLAFPLSVMRRNSAGRRIASPLSRLWEKCGIDRAIERAYAATVIATAGGWLAAAIASGPTVKPLPIAALIATVILAVPWWFHRRRRAKVRVERTISGWPEVADNIGLPGSRIASVVVDAWGWTARVILRKGTTVSQAIARIPDIESGLELRPGSVRVFPDGKHANRLVMRVVETEPLAVPIPWPGPSITISHPASGNRDIRRRPARPRSPATP